MAESPLSPAGPPERGHSEHTYQQAGRSGADSYGSLPGGPAHRSPDGLLVHFQTPDHCLPRWVHCTQMCMHTLAKK